MVAQMGRQLWGVARQIWGVARQLWVWPDRFGGVARQILGVTRYMWGMTRLGVLLDRFGCG